MKKITSKDEFDELLHHNLLVVVDFTASWCGPCRFIGPKFEKMAEEFSKLCCVKVDVDENDDLAKEYKIRGMPTFMFFKNGEKVEELVGANEEKLRELMM